MRRKRSVDKGRRMERRKDSAADEQDVQNERNDRTREAKTVESPRNEVESRKKRHRENWKKRKKRQAWNIGVREKD